MLDLYKETEMFVKTPNISHVAAKVSSDLFAVFSQ